jgi:hypothetical protein
MGRIYKSCEECIVYLGDNLDGSTPSSTEPPPVSHFDSRTSLQGCKNKLSHKPGIYDVFSFFHELYSGGHLDRQSAFESGPNVPKTGLEYDKAQLRSKLFEALRKFMHAPFTPWWTRIWVIQEVTAPPFVMITYGTISASWNMFVKASRQYNHHSAICCRRVIQNLLPDQGKVIVDSCKKIAGIQKLRSDYRKNHVTGVFLSMPRGLLNLLREFRDRKASDPRDKVYALLSIVQTPSGRSPLIPDYSQSETEVFLQAALESIYTTKSLSMFSTELGRKFRTDLPSWVPDWGAPGGHTYTERAKAVSLYDASLGKATPETVVLINGSALRLQASRLMSVDLLGEVMLGDDDNYSRQTLDRWWSLWRSQDGDHSKTILPSEFARLLCAGVIFTPYQGHGVTNFIRSVESYDERTFESWAKYSRISPVGEPNDRDVSADVSAWMGLWKEFMLWWPQDPLSYADDTPENRDKYLPASLIGYSPDGAEFAMAIASLGQRLEIIEHTDIDLSTFFDQYRHGYGNVPWKYLFLRVRELLVNHYGPDIDLDLDARKALIPDIDNSIGVATLSRRLMLGGGLIGLGPAATAVGDEVFLLTGGRTPFVLRRHEDTNRAVPGPKFEIIGDCYVSGWMNGNAERLALCEWTDITLV